MSSCKKYYLYKLEKTPVRLSVNVFPFFFLGHLVSLTGFRADGNGAGQRVGQAGYDQSGGGTQKTDAEVMS